MDHVSNTQLTQLPGMGNVTALVSSIGFVADFYAEWPCFLFLKKACEHLEEKLNKLTSMVTLVPLNQSN